MCDREIDLDSVPRQAPPVLTLPAAFLRSLAKAGGFPNPWHLSRPSAW